MKRVVRKGKRKKNSRRESQKDRERKGKKTKREKSMLMRFFFKILCACTTIKTQ